MGKSQAAFDNLQCSDEPWLVFAARQAGKYSGAGELLLTVSRQILFGFQRSAKIHRSAKNSMKCKN